MSKQPEGSKRARNEQCGHPRTHLKIKKRKNSERAVLVCSNKITFEGKEQECGEEVLACGTVEDAKLALTNMRQDEAGRHPKLDPDI